MNRSARAAWNSNHRTTRKMGWSLAFGASLELGAWNLDLLRILVLGSSPDLGAWIFYCIPNFTANSSTIQFGLLACNASAAAPCCQTAYRIVLSGSVWRAG